MFLTNHPGRGHNGYPDEEAYRSLPRAYNNDEEEDDVLFRWSPRPLVPWTPPSPHGNVRVLRENGQPVNKLLRPDGTPVAPEKDDYSTWTPCEMYGHIFVNGSCNDCGEKQVD